MLVFLFSNSFIYVFKIIFLLQPCTYLNKAAKIILQIRSCQLSAENLLMSSISLHVLTVSSLQDPMLSSSLLNPDLIKDFSTLILLSHLDVEQTQLHSWLRTFTLSDSSWNTYVHSLVLHLLPALAYMLLSKHFTCSSYLKMKPLTQVLLNPLFCFIYLHCIYYILAQRLTKNGLWVKCSLLLVFIRVTVTQARLFFYLFSVACFVL